MTNLLRWRRQFLLTRVPLAGPTGWEQREVGSYCLYSHPDLDVTAWRQAHRELVLLGYLFDAEDHRKGNAEILASVAERVGTLRDLVIALKPYAGRYVLLLRDADGLTILQDPLALREVYYCTQENAVVCGSQPGLIAEFANPAVERSRDPMLVEFLTRDMKSVRNGRLWVGDGSFVEGVKHLLPNRYLHVDSVRVARFWPNEPWQAVELGDAVDRACSFLQGMMRAVTHRHSVMMAVTAGTDSRTLLAASRDISDRIYYFINKPPRLTSKSADVWVPTTMFRRIGIPFHVHEVSQDVDPEFRSIFLRNTAFASELLLPAIFNVYFRDHPGKMNILGVGEIGRAHLGREPKGLNAYYLAYSLGYTRSQYATHECENWLREAEPIARSHGIDLMSLLLWEQLLGNWGVVGNAESDIAIEEFDPFDSHYLYEILLAVDDRAVNGNRQLVFREMIRTMWPELLQYPFNPPDTAQEALKALLKRVGVYPSLKRLRYRWHRHRYSRNAL